MKTRFRAECQCLLLGEGRSIGVLWGFSMNLQIIAGLGNPGREYEITRHNIGFMLADELCALWKGEWKNEPRFDALVAKVMAGRSECLLVKPQTFMNLSGQAVGGIARYYGVPGDKIIVAHDEYQIPVGEMKLTIGGGRRRAQRRGQRHGARRQRFSPLPARYRQSSALGKRPEKLCPRQVRGVRNGTGEDKITGIRIGNASRR